MSKINYGENISGGDDAMSKAERYDWHVIGVKPVVQEVSKSLLNIDYSYQRRPRDSRIADMCREWKWGASAAISVNQRQDGTYWVLDGQHRYLAAKRHKEIDALPCVVHRLETIEEEAEAYYWLNMQGKVPTVHERHIAMLRSGDVTARMMEKMVTDAGFHFCTSGSSPRSISCIAKCRKLATKNMLAWQTVMSLALPTCAADNCQLKEPYMDGLFYIHLQASLLDDPRFCDRVRQVGATQLTMDAIKCGRNNAQNNAKWWAIGLLDSANKGLHRKFTLDRQ